MSNEQRIKELSKLVKENGSLSVKELIEHFNVSDMTIRRDLKQLESDEVFKRFHGGIRYVGEEPLIDREIHHVNDKKKIAEYCVSLIEPNDTIILDAGSTTYHIAEEIANFNKKNITIITNSLKIATKLQNVEYVNLIMCGGELRQASGALIGSVARTFFEGIFAKKAFVSTGGITNHGLSTVNFSEAEIKQTIINSSESKYIVADASKFGIQSLNVFAPLDIVQTIITSGDISEELRKTIQQNGVSLRIT